MPETPEPLKPTEPGGEMEHQDPRHMDDLAHVQGDELQSNQMQGNDRGAMEAEGHVGSTYDPSRIEANRARMQGGGVGQSDMDLQRDPTRADSTEHYGQMAAEGGGRGEGSTDVEHGEARGGGTEQT